MITITMHKYFEDDNLKIYTAKFLFEQIVRPLMYASIKSVEKLTMDFDDAYGYPTSVLKELTERITFEFYPNRISNYIVIKSTEDETIPGLIEKWNDAFLTKIENGEPPTWL